MGVSLGLVQKQLNRVVVHERRSESNSFASLAAQQTATGPPQTTMLFLRGPLGLAEIRAYVAEGERSADTHQQLVADLTAPPMPFVGDVLAPDVRAQWHTLALQSFGET